MENPPERVRVATRAGRGPLDGGRAPPLARRFL